MMNHLSYGFLSLTKGCRAFIWKVTSTVGADSSIQGLHIASQACKDIRVIRKLHASILTHGLGECIFFRSKLLSCYAKFEGLYELGLVFVNNNLSGWNSAIIEYNRSDRFEEVLWLYQNLKYKGIRFNSSAITFSLKASAELGLLEIGQAIHVDAHKLCLNSDKFIGSSLIGLYSRCELIDDGHRAFQEIFDKDVVAYTSMITACATFPGFHANLAFRIAFDMHAEGLSANRVTLVSLLEVAGQFEALSKVQTIHCYALRRGIDLSDEALQTAIVDMYARCGASNLAASMLQQMQTTCVASWNALISGLVQWGKGTEALNVFVNMEKEAQNLPDSITVSCIITACANIGWFRQAEVIHGYIVRREILLDLVVVTSLVDLYSECGKILYARKLFDDISVRDIVLYNVIISGYLRDRKFGEAFKMLRRMIEAGINPNGATMTSFILAFSDIRDTRLGKWVHGFILRYNLNSNLDTWNQILHMYAKCGCIDAARLILESMTKKDLVSWTIMMMSCVDYGHVHESILLFHLMLHEGEKPDSSILITLIKAYIELGLLLKVKEIHSYIYRFGLVKDSATMSSIIIAYAQCGRLDIAKAVFDSIGKESLSPWNTIIAAYGIHGDAKEVLNLFYEMQRQNINPDAMTYTSVLSACSHTGLVEEGWNVFKVMDTEHHVSPSEEHYNCMVDLLSRAGQLDQAYDLVKYSPLMDKSNALCALLGACKVHKNMKLGEVIGKKLIEIEPHNAGIYSLVSNIYSEACMWNKATLLRNKARVIGLNKSPGFSIIN